MACAKGGTMSVMSEFRSSANRSRAVAASLSAVTLMLAGCGGKDMAPVPAKSDKAPTARVARKAPQDHLNCIPVNLDQWMPVPPNLNVPQVAKILNVEEPLVQSAGFGTIKCDETMKFDEAQSGLIATVKGLGSQCLTVMARPYGDVELQINALYHRAYAVCVLDRAVSLQG
jgi:hypothetical protein